MHAREGADASASAPSPYAAPGQGGAEALDDDLGDARVRPERCRDQVRSGSLHETGEVPRREDMARGDHPGGSSLAREAHGVRDAGLDRRRVTDRDRHRDQVGEVRGRRGDIGDRRRVAGARRREHTT